MRIALLGPLRLTADDGRCVEIGGARLRMLLIRLAVDAGRFVAVDTLVDGLWGEQPPADASNALQSLVSRLRRTVRDATGSDGLVASGPAGYRLDIAPDDVDAHRFQRLAATGRAQLRAGRAAEAAATLAEALALWQGTALAEVADAPFAGPVAARLAEGRLAAEEDRFDAALALGRSADLLGELDELVARHPLRERLVALRVRTLHAAGRTADALGAYERARTVLADELGVDPSAELRAAHLAVLRGDRPPTRSDPEPDERAPQEKSTGQHAPDPSDQDRSAPKNDTPSHTAPSHAASRHTGPAPSASGRATPSPHEPSPHEPGQGEPGQVSSSPYVPGHPASGYLAPGRAGQSQQARGRGAFPAPLTSFVGREADVARATALLAGHRLVSLVGAGGAGKTRLATELAARGSTALGGRVWFVELAPVRDGVELSDLLPAVLSALDVREIRVLDTQPAVPRPPVDRLVDLFIGAPALLVLDNCEHLVGAAAGLADVLLGRCPQLSVLATSREPLAITGEALHWVGPLELPVDLAPLAEARAAPAVRLFTDRAAAARPGFVLDEPNLAQVTEICRRLDGMPLALELAAARLRSMTPGQVAERLDDRFRLLTGGNRTSLPRHRTLHGVVEWSWELLTEPERTLARRLAVLSGGADAAAAVGVCSDADLAAEDVPYLLASLVEKSLLAVGEGVDGRPRYRMLETVRAYGLRELAQTGETRRLSAAFVRYFTEFAERVEPALRTADQLDAMARLGAEHDNVIAALGAAADARDAESTARLVGAMIWYWMLVGNSDEAMLWLRNAAALPAERESPATVGVRLATFLGENLSHLSRERFDVYWEGCRRAGVPERYPVAALVEPIVRIRQGDVDGALASARRIGEHRDPWARAAGRLAVCVVAVHMADVETADVELHAALAEFRALGERWGIAFSLGLLGQYLLISGDSAGAVAAHEEAVRVGGELGAFNLPPMQLIQLGAARGRAGDLDGAERDVRAALDGWAGVQGDLQLMALCVLVHIAVSRGDLDTAHELAAEAEATPDGGGGSGHGDPQLVAVLAVAKSRIALAEDDLDAAAAHLARALELSMPILDMSSVAGIGERISMVVARRGAPAEAARLLGASAGVRGLLDRGEPDVIALLTDLTDRLGPSGFEQAYSSGFELERDVAVAALRDAVSGHPAVVEVHGQGEEHRDDADQPRH